MPTKASPRNGKNKPGERPSRRRYQSPLRAQRAEETKAAVIAAASRLFTTNGWVSTGMRDVAAEAGVSTETVYSYFSSKRRLLESVIDIAVVGDANPVAVSERPEFAALGQGTRVDRIGSAARLVSVIHQRTGPFAKVIREAASSDTQIAEVLRATRERQRQDTEAGITLIIGRKPTPAERDGVWVILSPETYLLLVEESGWTFHQYQSWLAETLEHVLPSP